MPKFCPEGFKPTPQNIEWAMSKGLNRKQIDLEVEKMVDHEFRRSYSDWQRVFRNWIRKAIEIGTVQVDQRTKLDEDAESYGLQRQPGESDESLKRRLGIAQTAAIYARKSV